MYKKMASLLLVLVFAVSMLTAVPVLGADSQNGVFGDLPAPDPSLTENVIDEYLPKNGLSTELAKYSFDTEADVEAWTLAVAKGKVTDATKGMDIGVNGTTGSIKQTAGGVDYRPRIYGPDVISWNRGSTYTITAWIKGDSEFEISPWINTGAKIYSTAGNNTYLAYGRKKLTTEWKEYTWEFTISDIVQSGASVPSVPSEFYIRMGEDNPAHTFWMDELVITETIPGYTKLGLMAETTQLFSNETVELAVVGNNGQGNYKVAKEGMTFQSSDEAVATVDVNGVVTAKSSGTARIAVSDGEIMGTIDIIVEEKTSSLPDPDPSLTENVIDTYLPKEGVNKEVEYSFDTEADVEAWTLAVDTGRDTDKKVTDATKSKDAGANGTTGSIKQTAGGQDARPRIYSPDVISWNRGSTYTITAWMKGESEFQVSPWINTGAKIYSTAGNNTYLAYGRKTLTTEWKEYNWEFTINDIQQNNVIKPFVSSEFYIRMYEENPVHTFWMDELVITETIPGYTKLGLMAEKTQLLSNETAELTVVGNNGRANYKVAKEGMTFVSSDKAIATVDANGVVTAKEAGQVRIGVTDGEYTGTIDITVEDSVQVKYTIGANGSVKVGDVEKADGQTDQIAVGEDVTLTLIPDKGYKAKVMVNGEEITVPDSNEVTVEQIQTDTEIAVSFDLLPVTPSISGSKADYIVTEENYHNNQPAYIAYYKITIPANATLSEYGMYFNEKDGAEENAVRLVAKGKNDMNMFGIRVFGAAVTADKEYAFKGFAVIDDQEYTD